MSLVTFNPFNFLVDAINVHFDKTIKNVKEVYSSV